MAKLAQKLREAVLQAAIEGKLTESNYEEKNPLDDLENYFVSNSFDGRKVKAKDIKLLDSFNEPFEIKENWRWVRLGKVCTVARGGSPRPIKEYITEDADGINWIKIGDTDKGGKYITRVKEKIKPSGMKKSRFVKSGDFLLTNSMSFGRPYILKVDGCIHDGWLVISQEKQIFNQDYLYWLLSSQYAYFQFLDQVSGAVVKNLNSEKVVNSVFPLPPIEEQQRIVERVEELMAKIDEFEVVENKLEALKKAFPEEMKNALLQAAMEGRLTERSKNDSKIFEFVSKEMEEPDFEIPIEWKFAHVESISKSISSKQYQISDSQIQKEGLYPVVSQSKEYIIGYTNKKEKLFVHNNPVIIFGDHTTVVKHIDFDFVVGADGTKIFDPIRDIINSQYLTYALKYYSIGLDKKGGYSRHYKFIKNKPIPIPPIEEQGRIVEKLDKLLPLCEGLVVV